MTLKEIAEKICKEIPEDYEIALCFENGSAWVELIGKWDIDPLELPDSADLTLEEQLEDALEAAIKYDNQ